MSELTAEIKAQVAAASQTLRDAVAAGDDFLAGVSRSELEDLARLADDHDLRIPELDALRGAA